MASEAIKKISSFIYNAGTNKDVDVKQIINTINTGAGFRKTVIAVMAKKKQAIAAVMLLTSRAMIAVLVSSWRPSHNLRCVLISNNS